MKATNKSMTPIIVRTGIFTFVVFFVSVSYGAMIFGFMFPKTMAGFCTSLGFDNAAAMHYQRVYHRNPTNQNLHRVIDRAIVARNHNMVIRYFERFYRDDNVDGRQAVIDQINVEGRAKAGNNIVLLRTWANEDSRLRTEYMYSLIQTNQVARARDIFIQWMNQAPDVTQPNFAILSFFGTGTASDAVIDAFAGYFVAFRTEFINASASDGLGGHFISFFEDFIDKWLE